MVYFDTSAVIFLLDPLSAFHERAISQFNDFEKLLANYHSSVYLMAEYHGKYEVAQKGTSLFDRFVKDIDLVEHAVTIKIVNLAIKLKSANRSLKTADAIHLATALEKNCTYFFTNDFGIPKITGLEMIYVEAKKPLD